MPTLTRIAAIYRFFGFPPPRVFLVELLALGEEERRELAQEAARALGVSIGGWS